MKANKQFENLGNSYLFAEIAARVAAYKHGHPGQKILRLGIGDVTLPLPRAAVDAMAAANAEMLDKSTFRGYGENAGEDFLLFAIKKYYADTKNVKLDTNDIFVSDGAKSDCAAILSLFDADNTVLLPDPVYPAYVDINVMDGRRVAYVNGTFENGFLPTPDGVKDADIIYICSPNNPTGAVYDFAGLKAWVDFANKTGAVILYDAAYEGFIRDKNLPTSIYQIEGAQNCAIEICTFSKLAGFTGTRLGWTVVPSDLERDGANLRRNWARRRSAAYNGAPYVIQRGGAAVLSGEGLAQARENIAYYLGNAKILRDALTNMGIELIGGDNAPYIWLKCPKGYKSWDYFDLLLNQAQVVGTPGAGFGVQGEGFLRLSSFGSREDVTEAVERIGALKKLG
ncbi:LL-diaminopimelate aminotransferase [Clostridia bacterium]|nr:LL-diaminopimelate aminotransferase [Clostridia bacterium]